jgi:hypothetical protein
MIIPNNQIERRERHLSHICQPPQLRLDGGTLSSLIGALRSLTHERKMLIQQDIYKMQPNK